MARPPCAGYDRRFDTFAIRQAAGLRASAWSHPGDRRIGLGRGRAAPYTGGDSRARSPKLERFSSGEPGLDPRAGMKILHLDLGREWRGGQQQVLYLTEGLTRRGHESVVATPEGSPLAQRLTDAGLAMLSLPVRSPRLPRSALRVRRWLEHEEWQVVHAHTAHAHTVALAALKLSRERRPTLFVSRRVDFRPGRGPIHRLKYTAGDPRFICVSEGVRRVMEASGIEGSRLHVVHSGVEVPPQNRSSSDARRALKRELGVPGDGLLIGQIGQLVPHKGQAHLLEAMARVERAAAHLVIVGDGPLAEALDAQRRALGLESAVTFTGYRAGARRFLSAFDLYVSSSVEEGLGTSILDAAAHGLAVIATTAGGSAETVIDGETGYLVAPGDAAALAARINALLADASMRERMGHAGRTFIASRFSRDAMVEGTLALYEAAR